MRRLLSAPLTAPTGCRTVLQKLALFLGGLQDLQFEISASLYDQQSQRTWNEQRSVSSTLIIAPALSNSPQ